MSAETAGLGPVTTKEKIELGGLAVIAGMRAYDKETVLGIMLDGMARYEQSPLEKREHLKSVGRTRLVQRARAKKGDGQWRDPVVDKDNTLGDLPSWRII